MKAKRVWLLIKNEIIHGPKDVILVMAVLMPVLLALFVNLAFGNIFSEKAKIGVFDQGDSSLLQLLNQDSAIVLKVYDSEALLRAAAARGSVDMGLVLAADFDQQITTNTINLKAYIWGESPAKNRAVIPVMVAGAVRQMSGATLPVTIETVSIGGEESQPWSNRLLPLTILMAVFFGGLMLPAASLIHDKSRRILEALNVTPVTIGEIFAAKGIIGVILASLMGIITLVISGGLANSLASLSLILILGAVMAVEIGLLAGALIKDLNTLFAFWKFGAIFLFGPAIIFMFPQIPQWIGYIFPTFYVIKPIVELISNGSQLGEVIWYLVILCALITALFLVVNRVVRRLSTRALRINS